MNLSKLKSLNKFSSKGFTLIELLVVIAILGVLAATVLVAINPGQRIAAARNSRVKVDLATMGQQANVFNADMGLSTTCIGGGSYPSSFPTTTAVCGQTYLAGGVPVPPTDSYSYLAYTVTGTTTACAAGTTPCGAISIAGPAYPDPNSAPAVTNIVSAWCWRSASGTIRLQSAAATLALNKAACLP